MHYYVTSGNNGLNVYRKQEFGIMTSAKLDITVINFQFNFIVKIIGSP